MRSIEEIAADVFNGMGPSLHPDEQLHFSFVYGEHEAVTRGLTHYMTEADRAKVIATTEPIAPRLSPPEEPTANDSNSAPGPNQTIEIPLLEATSFLVPGVPDGATIGLVELLSKLGKPFGQPDAPELPPGEVVQGVVSTQDADTAEAGAQPSVPAETATAAVKPAPGKPKPRPVVLPKK